MNENYLKKNKRHIFDSMLISGKLHSYLADIDEQARDMFDNLLEQMKSSEGVTEELKEQNQWEWVQKWVIFRRERGRLFLRSLYIFEMVVF